VKTSKNYLLGLLTLIMVFNYVDRVALGLLLQDIKVALSLSDTQLGLLTGIAFAAFYATMGIPIARCADRGNRVAIISITVALWSATVALCSVARSFTQLLFLRMGVAIGEAGCHPPAFSLISDYFNRGERPRAVARYMLGWPLALLAGFFAGGWLNEIYGWRATFVILGLPGLVLAAVAALTLKEPRRAVGAKRASSQSASQEPVPLIDVLRTLGANAAYRNLLFAFSLSYYFGNGILQWLPVFFARSHGLSSGVLGTWFAMVYGFGTLFGTWLGGEIASRYAANNERAQLAAVAILYLLMAFLGAGVYIAPNYHLAFLMLIFSAIGSAVVIGPMFAATQALVPPQMRAMSIAIVLFFSNLIGLGFGPLTVGALSDALRPLFGDQSLRIALLAMCPGYFWCAWHLWRASRAISETTTNHASIASAT
jgi:predicted MFS family arabinose efflux permease